jgi:glycosyltransferase involved in cell wall biosynthesis
MKKPVISVVIPALNEEKYLGKTLESLQKQDFKNFEIIVVDNGSIDKTAQIAKNFGARVIFEQKKGVPFARQAGFEKANGKIIATTDADTILPQNWLLKIHQTFLKNPQAVAVTGFFDFYDSSIIFRILFLFLSRLYFLATNSFSGTNIAIKKEAFEKIGGFNFNYLVGEDTNICRRLKKIGKVIRNHSLLVKTSGRRYQKTGIIGTLWDYLNIYFRCSRKISPIPVFKGGSGLENLASRKVFDYLLLLAALFLLSGISFKINPAVAQVIRNEKNLYSQKINQLVPKISPPWK